MTSPTSPTTPARRLADLLGRLVEPAPSVTRSDERRNVRLMATLLGLISPLIFVAAAGEWAVLGLAPHVVVELAAGVALAASWWLSRTRHHRPAAILGMAVLGAVPYAVFLARANPDPRALYAALPWSVIPCAALAVFYSVRAGAWFLGAAATAMVALAALVPWVSVVDVGLCLAIVAALSVVSLLVVVHQRRLEKDRVEELASRHAELAQLRSDNAQLLARAKETTRLVTSAAGDILIATRQQGEGAAEQSASATQTAAAVQDLDRLAQEAAQTSREVADALGRAEATAQTGRASAAESAQALARLREDIRAITEHMRSLAEHARRVGEIINAVEDFAAQSKILALNASIEAASAGATGAGFGVVAKEIRSLAERSRSDTAQVRAILQEILRGARQAAEATERGVASADERIRLVGEVRASIEQVAETVRTSAQQALSAAERGVSQAQGIGSIATAVKGMSDTTAQSLSSTGRVEASAQLLMALATELEKVVESCRT